MPGTLRRWRITVLVGLDAAALATLMPDWSRLGRHLANVDGWVAEVGADNAIVTVASAALWLAAIWLGGGLGALMLSAAPGRLGAAAAGLADLIVPAAMLRLLAGAAGITISLVAVAPTSASAQTVSSTGSSTGSGTAAPSTPSAPAVPGRPQVLGWPTDTDQPHASPPQTPRPVLQLDWPSTPGATETPEPATPATPLTPLTPLTPPTPPTPPTTSANAPTPTVAPTPPAPPAEHVVVVRPGDCLWGLAASQLGEHANASQISQLVQAWYLTNREVIGSNPALLHPGQQLTEPPIRSTS